MVDTDGDTLLRALAFAEGEGLPGALWATVAGVLAGEERTEYGVREFCEREGARLVTTVTPAGAVHRLRDPREVARLREAVDERQVQRAITTALLARVPRGDWTAADPYLRGHLAAHAAAGGLLDELLEDTGYLVHAEPAGLLAALYRSRPGEGSVRRDVYRASADVHAFLDASRRRDVLAVDAARHNQPELAAELTRGRNWRLRWATGSKISPALRLTRPGPSADAMACIGIDGRPHAVTGLYDGTVRVWDVADGSERLVMREKPGVYALDCVEIEGRPHTVTGSSESTVRLWDLMSGTERAVLDGHRGWVRAVACTEIDGRPIAVTAGEDQVVRLWDLVDGVERARLTGHTDEVRAVACTEINGRPVAVTGGYDGTVRVWDLDDGVELTVLRGHTSAVYGAACTTIEGRPHAVTADGDGVARVWCLTDGSERAVLTGHDLWVTTVACTEIEGRPHAVTGGGDRTARVWDLTDGSLRTVLRGHHREVDAVACVELDGHPHAVTGGHAARPRIWDLAPLSAGPGVLEGHTAEVAAVRCVSIGGRPYAVTGGGTTVRLWDLADGSGSTTYTNGLPVLSLDLSTVHGRPFAVAGGQGDDVRGWDLTGGDEPRELSGHSFSTLAVACLEIDGRSHAATADEARVIRVWDLEDGGGGPSWSTRTRSAVRAMEAALIDGRPHLLTGGDDGGLRVWRITGSGRRAVLAVATGHYSVRALAHAGIDGHSHALTVGDNSSTVYVWNLSDGSRRASLEHDAPVADVTCTELGGRPHAVTVGTGRTLCVWDLADHRLMETIALPLHAQAVAADGPDIVIGMCDEVVVLTLGAV